MTTQEAQNYLAPILKEIHTELYGNGTSTIICRCGWNTWGDKASLRVFSTDLDEAIELLEMNNLAYKINPDQYVSAHTDIIVFYK